MLAQYYYQNDYTKHNNENNDKCKNENKTRIRIYYNYCKQ